MVDINDFSVENKSLKKINWFEENQLVSCMWCKYGGLFFNTEDNLVSVVCLDFDSRIKRKKDKPPNREYRYYLKVMDSLESCEKFKPTPEKSDRILILEWLGMTQGYGNV